MEDLELVRSARLFAISAHEAVEQKRKYTNDPYWKHSERVAFIVKAATNNANAIAAAWLHDVVEDTGVTIQTIFDEFGRDVGILVSDVTDVSKPEDGNRKIRKELDRQHLAKATPLGMTIKLADLIDNLASIGKHDSDFAKVYMAEKKLLLEVLTEGNTELHRRATEIVDAFYAGVNSK